MATTEQRLKQIVVERTGGDVYITHNLDEDVLVSFYDWDYAEEHGFDLRESTDAEVTVGQKYVDECHNEWSRAARQEERDRDQQDDLYDCWKDYWNDRGPDEDHWSD